MVPLLLVPINFGRETISVFLKGGNPEDGEIICGARGTGQEKRGGGVFPSFFGERDIQLQLLFM